MKYYMVLLWILRGGNCMSLETASKKKLNMKEVKEIANSEVEIVLDYIDNMNFSSTPKDFFDSLSKMRKRVEHLTLVNGIVKIKNKNPKEFLEEIKDNTDAYICNFIDKYINITMHAIKREDTLEAKKEIFEGFLKSFELYEKELGRKGRNYLKLKKISLLNEIEPDSVYQHEDLQPIIQIDSKNSTKKPIILLITSVLGTICALWGILVFTHMLTPEFLHTGAAGAYSILFMSTVTLPHILLVSVASFMNYLAYFFRIKGCALAAGCLYIISFVVGAGYILLIGAITIMSFIGYSKVVTSKEYINI